MMCIMMCVYMQAQQEVDARCSPRFIGSLDWVRKIFFCRKVRDLVLAGECSGTYNL